MFDALDRPGGQIVVSVLLILVGGVFEKIGIQHSGDIMIFALGVLARSMYGGTIVTPGGLIPPTVTSASAETTPATAIEVKP